MNQYMYTNEHAVTATYGQTAPVTERRRGVSRKTTRKMMRGAW